MQNLCDFCLVAKGEKSKLEQLAEWLQNTTYNYRRDSEHTLQYNGKAERHFWNIDSFDYSLYDNGDCYMSMLGNGQCKFSVEYCMIDNPCTMYSHDCIEDQELNSLMKKHEISLQEASKLLNLDIEIFSEEPKSNWAEHLVISNGEVVGQGIPMCGFISSEEGE